MSKRCVSLYQTKTIIMKITKQMQREFWKRNINPITGWKVDYNTDESALSKRSYLNKSSYDFDSELDLEDELENEVVEIDCTFDENFEELMEQINNL